jgi:hypothetical protein
VGWEVYAKIAKGWRVVIDIKELVAERVGFEPTVGKTDTRSPGAPDRPLQHLSNKPLAGIYPIFYICLTERVGFEPTLR